MAITSAICNSFKVELLKGEHNFTASTGQTYYIALFTSSANLGASTTIYSTTNEIANDSGSAYTAGGEALTNVTPVLSGSTAVVDFEDASWTDATFTANGALIYQNTTNKAVMALAFGGDKSVSNGTFTVTMPTADADNAILRLA